MLSLMSEDDKKKLIAEHLNCELNRVASPGKFGDVSVAIKVKDGKISLVQIDNSQTLKFAE